MDRLGESFTIEVYKFLQHAFASWIQSLEKLHPKTIPRNYGQIGDTPFLHMDIPKNYWISPHQDLGDTNMGFIMWFTRGDFSYV